MLSDSECHLSAQRPIGLNEFSLQVRQIKMMIAKAGSLEEIERLNMMLRNGQMPGMEETKNGETEEMETDR